MVLDPGSRLTAKEALNHPWVKGVGVRARHMGGTLENIKEFNAKRKTKGGVYALMAVTGLISKVKMKNDEEEHER